MLLSLCSFNLVMVIGGKCYLKDGKLLGVIKFKSDLAKIKIKEVLLKKYIEKQIW